MLYSSFFAETALIRSAKWCFGTYGVGSIDCDSTRSQAFVAPPSSIQIAREYVVGQTHQCIIALRDDLFLIAEGIDGNDRSELLFLVDSRLESRTNDQGRLEVVSRSKAFATSDEFGTSVDCIFD